jgi:hypothetical protein
MNNIINKINDNREKHKKTYNSINGKYAFEDFYEKYNYEMILISYSKFIKINIFDIITYHNPSKKKQV